MNKRRNILTVLFFYLILIFPLVSFSSIENGDLVSKRGTVNDDYYAAGRLVNVDAEVNGDVVVSGRDLFIGYRILADVMAVGGSINLRGEILDDVRVAGGDIKIDATIGDDLFAAGGVINIFSGTIVSGGAWLAGGEVNMAGTINKDLLIGAGKISISGTVQGDVELKGDEIQILEGTLIKGSLHYMSPHKAKIHPDAKIMGKVTYEHIEWDDSSRGYGIFFALTLVVASIVLFKLFPGFTMSAASRIMSDPWKSFGVGFVLLIVTPVVAILLMSVVLGIWVGLSILALYFLALLIGLLISCFFLGDWGAKILRKDVATTGRRLFSVTITIILLGLLQLIPVIGCLLVFTLLLLGLGAGTMQLHYVYYQSDVT